MFSGCGSMCSTATATAATPLLYAMQDDKSTYCGAEVRLSDEYVQRSTGPWFRVMVPLSAFRCDAGSVGGLAAVDRFDLQNTNIRDANVCLDDIQLD